MLVGAITLAEWAGEMPLFCALAGGQNKMQVAATPKQASFLAICQEHGPGRSSIESLVIFSHSIGSAPQVRAKKSSQEVPPGASSALLPATHKPSSVLAMILQAGMDDRNPPAAQSAPFFWPFSKSSGNLAALLNPAQGSSLENVVTSAAAAAAAAAANAAVAAVFSAAGMPNPVSQEAQQRGGGGAIIRPEPSLAAPKNSSGMEEMRQSTTQSLLDTLQAALNSQKEEGTAGVEKDGNLELQPNLGLSLDLTRSQSSTQNAFLAAFQAANGAAKRAPDGPSSHNARSEGSDALLTKLQLALKASSKRDEGGAGPVHAERDLMSALEGGPRGKSAEGGKKNDQVQHDRRAVLWEEACEEEERGVGVAAIDANGRSLGKSGSGFGKSGSGYSSKGGGSGVIWPDQDGQVADPIELSKRSASIAWPEDSARKKGGEPWLARLSSGDPEGKLDAVQNGDGPPKAKGTYTEQHRAEQALRTLAQMAGGRDGGPASLGPSPASFSLSLGDIQQQFASPSGGKSNTALAPLTLATASLRRLLGLGPLQSPDAGKSSDVHFDRNGGHADGRPEDDVKSPFELNPLLRAGGSGPASVGGGSAAGTPTVVGFKRERLESIERYKEKRRRRQLNVTESKQSDRSDEEDGGGGDEPKKGGRDEPARSPTPPRMRGPMPSPSPKGEERSATPPPSREGSPGVTVAQPAGGRRRRLAQLPLDEAKAKNVMAHRASAARSNAKKKAALERVQRLEAMLGPVRAALIGACERDDELKQLLLKRAGSKVDALSKFVDGEQSLDDLLQATSISSKK
ncbi:hypothetical protein KFL_001250240 [Klebsormidium nitens]|uniref:BZIP domain-containing protein n=1 Tax=Klebsormidium nitens TaxID=105231 RepID=A0A1Y1I253_KLENI|nr:hypothetical protein KFL_001250240 [Klebsormidium nitens]|eukprot:GAQ82827.1 hypothetical protein KFL_001250240 [Klebsormidium nitens]